jgi:peptide/nickel transport system ATP-binding protein
LSAIVELKHVYRYYREKDGGILSAVDDLSLSISPGDVFSLVGESGSGKTTVGKLSVGLTKPSRGEVMLDGENIKSFKQEARLRKVQYVHQDPYSALDPYLTVREVLERPLIYLKRVKEAHIREEIMYEQLDQIGLGYGYLMKNVRELSGGEKQRILLARVFIIEPEYVVADEPTTMLDSVHRNEILNLLIRLKQKMNASLMVITHDISAVSLLSGRVGVMYQGELMEEGTSDEVLKNPLHPYTLALLAVTPEKIVSAKAAPVIAQRSNYNLTRTADYKGCKYAGVCPYAFDKCRTEKPELTQMEGSHRVACFKYPNERDGLPKI